LKLLKILALKSSLTKKKKVEKRKSEKNIEGKRLTKNLTEYSIKLASEKQLILATFSEY
jgi:hypothetical protein